MILFVGDKPSPKMKPGARAFEGSACEDRLNTWIMYLLDITPLEMALETRVSWEYSNSVLIRDIKDSYYVVNVSDIIFSLVASRHNQYLDAVVALGDVASKALEKEGTPHFKLPHPSGRNRQINDKEFIAKKLEECKNWLRSQNE